MSNNLTERDNKDVRKIIKQYKKYTNWTGIIERWENGNPDCRKKILTSLRRQANRQIKECSNEKRKLILGVGLELERLFRQISWIIGDMEKEPLRPSERQKIIERVGTNATQIIRDMRKIGLPFGSTHYFTDDEISARYEGVLIALGLCDLVSESREFDWDGLLSMGMNCGDMNKIATEYPNVPALSCLDDAKESLEIAEAEQYESVDICVTEVLVKLTDKRLLDDLARPADVSKINATNYKRTFVIRKLTKYFMRRYGEGLQATTAAVCVLIFGDESIDRDTVRSALTGYKEKPKYKQISSMYPFQVTNILGRLKPGILEKILQLKEDRMKEDRKID